MEPQSQTQSPARQGWAGQSTPLGKGPEEKQPKGRCLQAQMRPTDMRVRGDGQAGRLAGHRAPKDPQYPSSSLSLTQPAHHRALLSPPRSQPATQPGAVMRARVSPQGPPCAHHHRPPPACAPGLELPPHRRTAPHTQRHKQPCIKTEMLLGGSGAAWVAPAWLQPHGTRGSVHRTQTVLGGESSRKCRRRWRR